MWAENSPPTSFLLCCYNWKRFVPSIGFLHITYNRQGNTYVLADINRWRCIEDNVSLSSILTIYIHVRRTSLCSKSDLDKKAKFKLKYCPLNHSFQFNFCNIEKVVVIRLSLVWLFGYHKNLIQSLFVTLYFLRLNKKHPARMRFRFHILIK